MVSMMKTADARPGYHRSSTGASVVVIY